MEAPPISLHPRKRGCDPDRIAAMNQRSREKTERLRERAELKREELRTKRELAKAKVLPVAPSKTPATLNDCQAVLSAMILGEMPVAANIQLEAVRIYADSQGWTKGGARDTGPATAEAVSAVVLESSAIAARAAERDRTRARMLAAGMDAATIAAILGEGDGA